MPKPSKLSVISYKTIGQRVRQLRLAHDLTQAQLAKIMGTSQTALSELERGNRGLTVQQVVKLARSLKVTPNEILGDERHATARPLQDGRVLRRLSRLEQLPEPQRLAVLKVLDGIIAAHASGRPA